MSIVEFRDVSRVYVNGEHEQRALDHVELHLEEGKFIVILGPSGAGKTTLLDIICGKTRPSNGKIIYHGGKDLGIRKFVNIDLTKLTEAEIVAEGIGRKFQAPSVFTSLTVWENMEISLKGSKSVWGSLLFRISDAQKKQIENTHNLEKIHKKMRKNCTFPLFKLLQIYYNTSK